MSEAVFHAEFRNDLRYWSATDKSIARRVLDLVDAVMADPYEGIGEPVALIAVLEGCWCRRVEREHRLVYRVEADRVEFLQARMHY